MNVIKRMLSANFPIILTYQITHKNQQTKRRQPPSSIILSFKHKRKQETYNFGMCFHKQICLVAV